MKSIVALLLISLSLIAGGKAYKKLDVTYTQVGMWYEEGKEYYGKITKDHQKALEEGLTIREKHKLRDKRVPKVSTDLLINGTNFGRGTFIPVNTPVIIVGKKSHKFFFMHDEKTIMLFNRDEYTKLNNDDFRDRQLSDKQVDLSMFGENDKKNILRGRVTIGMSKKAVLLTRGYPPAHKTPNLKSNRWRYWEERSHSHYYYFVDGKFDGTN